MAEPGYLRMYGSTVRLLSERGHTVLLAYDSPGKRGGSAAHVYESLPGVELVAGIPVRKDARVERLRQLIDFLRFSEPRFAAAPHLRRRMEKYLSPSIRLLRLLPARLVVRALLALERRVPTEPAIDQYLRDARADVVLVTPLIARGRSGVRQTDTVKSARALGIPVAVGVSSWDHLTTKGLFKVVPDRVFVWNDVQRSEAVELHALPPAVVAVTGAQLFDRFFELEPRVDRDTFTAECGLDPAKPFVLYVGSSPNVAPPEKEIFFVRQWHEAVQARFPGLGVLVRPHPGNADAWAPVSLPGNAAVRPRARTPLPMSEPDELLYLHSLRHAAAVVGLNTSAEIEALVQRRPVLTVTPPELAETQAAPPHFRYLLEGHGGCVRRASSLDEHVEQLAAVLAGPESFRPAIDAFLRGFVRPGGLDVPATPVLVDELERLAR